MRKPFFLFCFVLFCLCENKNTYELCSKSEISSLDILFLIYTIVSCNSVKNGLIYILYCFMYIYVYDIVCQHETLINYKT